VAGRTSAVLYQTRLRVERLAEVTLTDAEFSAAKARILTVG
jgi:hypothetical protein